VDIEVSSSENFLSSTGIASGMYKLCSF